MSTSVRRAIVALALFPGMGWAAVPAAAHEFKVGAIVVDHPWSRQTPPGAKVCGAYLSITNTGTLPDRFVGGSAAVAGGFEVHASQTKDGVARMRRIDDGVTIAPCQTVTLAPMGTHVMLTKLARPIVAGEPFTGTLVFERAGKVDVSFTVEPLGGRTPEVGKGEHEGHGQ